MVKKIFLFFVITTAIYTAIVLYFYKYTNFSQYDDSFEILLKRNKNKKAKTLLIGNSRFVYGVDKKLLKNTNVFNRGGCTAGIYFKMLKYYLKHNEKPKKLIISIGFGSLYNANDSFFDKNPTFCSLINIKNENANFFKKYKDYAMGFIYPKKFFRDDILKPNFLFQNKLKRLEKNQKRFFKESKEQRNKESLAWYEEANKNRSKTYEKEVITSLKKLSNFCKKNNIELIVLKEPLHQLLLKIIYKKHSNWVEEEKYVVNQIKMENETIKFYNFEEYYKNHTGIFYDSNHLNKRGREIFTKHLARILSIN